MLLMWVALLCVFLFVMITWVNRPTRSFKYEGKDEDGVLHVYAQEKVVFRAALLTLVFALITVGMLSVSVHRARHINSGMQFSTPDVKRDGSDRFIDMGKPHVHDPQTIHEYKNQIMESK